MWSIVLSLHGSQLAISVYPGKCPQNPAVRSKWNSFSVLPGKPCWFSWPLIPLLSPVSLVTVLVSFFLSFLGATQRQSPGMLYWKLWSTQMKVFPFHVGLLSPSLLRSGLCRGLLQERPLLQASSFLFYLAASGNGTHNISLSHSIILSIPLWHPQPSARLYLLSCILSVALNLYTVASRYSLAFPHCSSLPHPSFRTSAQDTDCRSLPHTCYHRCCSRFALVPSGRDQGMSVLASASFPWSFPFLPSTVASRRPFPVCAQ